MWRGVRATGVALILGLPSIAWACLWDHDTLRMERARFPTAHELITGKFLRHSPEFYEWRIEDRLKRLENDPENAALLDDLAVAYDKIGQHEKAIETALRTERIHPGRYETAANLGTFYIHAGRLEEGLPEIERALKINPEAHFGREKYQKLLVEYVLARRKAGESQPPLCTVKLSKENSRVAPDLPWVTCKDTFAEFLPGGEVAFEGSSETRLPDKEQQAAITGLLGMMRFGKHDAPILLEALGFVLRNESNFPEEDAKLLAARAFLMASYGVPEGPARIAYRGIAAETLILQARGRGSDQLSLKEVEAEFQKELDDANQWYATVQERERAWISSGANPEEEFDKLYDKEPAVVTERDRAPRTTGSVKGLVTVVTKMVQTRRSLNLTALVVTIAGLTSGLFVVIWWRLRLRRSATRNALSPSQ